MANRWDGYIKKTALCHPERPHQGLGLCKRCYTRQHRLKNLDRERTKANEYRKRRRESHYWQCRQWRLKSLYNISLEQFNKLLTMQNSVCAICKKTPSDIKGFVVDHCHKTGKIRGLLCGSCNRGLGQFKDDLPILQDAVEYLRRYNEDAYTSVA